MKHSSKHFILTLLLALTLLACGDGKIRVGLLLPLSGDAKSYGLGARKGIELALKDSGLGERVVIFTEDSQCSGQEAPPSLKKLIRLKKVVAVIGELCSSASLAAAPVAEEEEVPMLSPASTSPRLKEAGDYIFRTIPSDALQSAFASELLFNNGFRKLAVLFPNDDYGLGFSQALVEQFSALGGEVVALESFERGSSDLRVQLSKIKRVKPGVLFLISNSPEASVAALRQIKELGLRAALYGSEGLKNEEIAYARGAEGLTISSPSLGNSYFKEQYEAAYGTPPALYAAQAYDAFMMIAEAIKKGATTGPEIKAQLYSITFDGVSGPIAFDEYGEIASNYDVYQVVNRKFVLKNQ